MKKENLKKIFTVVALIAFLLIGIAVGAFFITQDNAPDDSSASNQPGEGVYCSSLDLGRKCGGTNNFICVPYCQTDSTNNKTGKAYMCLNNTIQLVNSTNCGYGASTVTPTPTSNPTSNPPLPTALTAQCGNNKVEIGEQCDGGSSCQSCKYIITVTTRCSAGQTQAIINFPAVNSKGLNLKVSTSNQLLKLSASTYYDVNVAAPTRNILVASSGTFQLKGGTKYYARIEDKNTGLPTNIVAFNAKNCN